MDNKNILELKNRKLDECLIFILVIPTKLYFEEKESQVFEKEVYLFFSCNIQGKRKYVATVRKDKFKQTSNWYDFFITLKSKGIEVLLNAVIPDDKELSKALKLAFKDIKIYISYFETINKISKYYSDSYSKNILGKIRKIYLSENIDGYNLALNDFKDTFSEYKFILDLLDNDFKNAKQYYDTDYKLRNFIFSFYFYRDITKKISKVINTKDHFSSLDDLIIPLIPDIQRIESRIFCTKKDLNTIINIIYEDKKDLIKSYL